MAICNWSFNVSNIYRTKLCVCVGGRWGEVEDGVRIFRVDLCIIALFENVWQYPVKNTTIWENKKQ